MPSSRCLVSLMVMLVASGCAAQAQERIKICGRELIRLAVSSCGSSRLRRSVPDLERGQHQNTPSWDAVEDQASEAAHTSPGSDGEKEVFTVAPHLLSPHISEVSGKISDICCENGCGMKELIQFC
ncbi:insulin-like 3 (Leydig cell) [Pholidichthys leucotaenia]